MIRFVLKDHRGKSLNMIISQKQARMLRKLDIVLVDGNVTMRKAAAKVLKSFGIASLRTAREGQEALDMLEKWPANLVITDINMKPMDGLTFTSTVRSNSGTIDPRTPIIALTGRADNEIIRSALVAGVNGILVRPIEPQALVNRIDKAVMTRVIYQLKGTTWVAGTTELADSDGELIYDGLLPQMKPVVPKRVEKQEQSGQEDDTWVLD